MSARRSQAQTGDTPGPKTPAEWASSIAYTIRATTRVTPGATVTFTSATSHENVVEIRYVVTDAAAFARFKANAASSRLDVISHWCNESRKGALIQGVVIHTVYALSSPSDQVDFTTDKSSCDRLPKVAPADAKTLAGLALAAAKAENEQAATASTYPFRFTQAVAHEAIVDLRFTVDAAAAAKMDRASIAGIFTGYICSKYRDSIGRGLAFHPVFTVNGAPIVDFIIDRPKC